MAPPRTPSSYFKYVFPTILTTKKNKRLGDTCNQQCALTLLLDSMIKICGISHNAPKLMLGHPHSFFEHQPTYPRTSLPSRNFKLMAELLAKVFLVGHNKLPQPKLQQGSVELPSLVWTRLCRRDVAHAFIQPATLQFKPSLVCAKEIGTAFNPSCKEPPRQPQRHCS